MHSCLTLVDYTWRDAEDSELPSPDGQARETAMRWRRITRSLDERSSVPGLLTDSQDRSLPQYKRSFQSDLDMGSGSSMPQTSRLRENSLLLLSNRQRPTYAASRRILSGPNRIWAPAGHCRYLLNRDPRTGEIQWSPESNEIMCSPRSLAEICMACLVRDWPCMLPPRQPSLRNVVSFLFNARDSRTTSQHRNRSDVLSGRRAVSVCSQVGRHTNVSSANTRSGNSSATVVRRQLRPMTYHDLPISLLHSLLGEAILQRDCAAIAGLVANWPDEQMVIRRLIPLEEFPLSTSYLTKPSFVLVSPETGRGSRTTLVKGPSLMDAFILGLLTRQSVCKLTSVDFTGFEEGNYDAIMSGLCFRCGMINLDIAFKYRPVDLFASVANSMSSPEDTWTPTPKLVIINLGAPVSVEPVKYDHIHDHTSNQDRRVSIELSRLPILWMKPESRNSEYVRRHLMASLHIGIPKKRLEAYFSRITSIYAIYESELGHGEPSETVTIHLDCNMTVDEVALGLSLQWLTPFRFSCNRLLLQRLPEIHFPPYSLIRLFDPLSITQFEMEDPSLGSSLAVVLPSAVGWLISLRNLRACSLPACIPPPPDFVSITSARNSANFFSSQSSSGGNSGAWQSGNLQTGSSSTHQSTSTPAFTSTAAACRLLNRALISLRYLQRLGLARCHLTGQLKILLNGLSQPLEYLNLQDCCLSPDDVTYLVLHWRPLQRLYELNLSRNNLSNVADETLEQLVRTVCLRPPGQLVCLSIAYTCLAVDRLTWLVGLMVGMNVNRSTTSNQNQQTEADEDDGASDKLIDAVSTLRVLCIQPFVPPSREAVHRILYRVARLSKLQRLHLLPAAYAFPASGESDQRELRMEWITHCRNYLRQRARPDVEVL